jgi:hypothetical protein
VRESPSPDVVIAVSDRDDESLGDNFLEAEGTGNLYVDVHWTVGGIALEPPSFSLRHPIALVDAKRIEEGPHVAWPCQDIEVYRVHIPSLDRQRARTDDDILEIGWRELGQQPPQIQFRALGLVSR